MGADPVTRCLTGKLRAQNGFFFGEPAGLVGGDDKLVMSFAGDGQEIGHSIGGFRGKIRIRAEPHLNPHLTLSKNKPWKSTIIRHNHFLIRFRSPSSGIPQVSAFPASRYRFLATRSYPQSLAPFGKTEYAFANTAHTPPSVFPNSIHASPFKNLSPSDSLMITIVPPSLSANPPRPSSFASLPCKGANSTAPLLSRRYTISTDSLQKPQSPSKNSTNPMR